MIQRAVCIAGTRQIIWCRVTGRIRLQLKLNLTSDENIVVAFRGMHVSPAKHGYVWLPRKCDYRTDRFRDGRTDRHRTKWYLWAAMLRRRHKMCGKFFKFSKVGQHICQYHGVKIWYTWRGHTKRNTHVISNPFTVWFKVMVKVFQK